MSETEITELKKTEITDRVKESVKQNGSKPELFGDIVRAAILILERLIVKGMQKAMDIVEKAIDKVVDVVKEIPNKMDSGISVKDSLEVQTEKKKMPFSVNLHQKAGEQNKADQLQQKSTTTVQSIIEQIQAGQKYTSVETKWTETEIPSQPKPSVLATKYSHLKEIESRLKEQNRAIFGREKKRDKLKEELSECTGIFKGGRRNELQQEIDSIDAQLSNMKKRLSSIVKEYKFDSVQAFYKEFNAAKRENLDYEAACTDWEKTYGGKAVNFMSISERLRQKEQIVKERELGRAYQARQKDKGAR